MYLGIYVKLYDWLRKKDIEKSNRKNVRKCQMWLMTVMTTKLHCFVHHGDKHNYYYCQVFKFQCTSSDCMIAVCMYPNLVLHFLR